MTEKRFNIHEQMSTILGYECVFDYQKEGWLSIRDTVLCLNELAEENEQLKSELTETKEILRSIEKDRNQTLLVCKKYDGFFKEKGYDIHDLIDYARDGGND